MLCVHFVCACSMVHQIPKVKGEKCFEPARIRTWNLLIRSQARYPLRHRSTCSNLADFMRLLLGPKWRENRSR